MGFGENLQYLRDRSGLTQEALAEQLEVSRQSVSKWESGGSFPEMEKLMVLCDLFHVDMDTLLRGSAAVAVSEDSTGYDKHQNWFARMIAGGTFLILFGISFMMMLNSIRVSDDLATALFLTMIAVAVVMFIVAGMTHDRYEKKYPLIQDFYTEEEKERNHKRNVIRIAGGAAAIIVAVAWLIIFAEQVDGNEVLELRLMSAFMLIVALAVYNLTYGGMQSEKCDIAKWNREHDQSPEQVALRRKVGVVCGCIMLGATVVFLAIGFGGMALHLDYGASVGWRWGWTVYPIAAVICAIAATIIKRNEEE